MEVSEYLGGFCQHWIVGVRVSCIYFKSIPHIWFCRYWETREQRAPALKTKTIQKTDQEQQDPMEYLQSDEEEDEEKNSAHSAACRRLQEQRERMHGALALIELANLAVAPMWQ